MKKFLLLLVLLLAVACGGPEAPTTETTDAEESETAVSTTDTATEDTPTDTTGLTSAPTSANVPADFIPASNPADASEVRNFDHIIGATDPAVTIIEYGDYQ